MIALGPSRTFEGVRAPGNKKSWQEQGGKCDAVNPWNGHIADHADGVGAGRKRRISLRLDTEIVVTCGNAGNNDGIAAATFVPGAIAIVPVVIAHFTAEVPGLPGVLIDERVIQINPVVIHGRSGLHLDS